MPVLYATNRLGCKVSFFKLASQILEFTVFKIIHLATHSRKIAFLIIQAVPDILANLIRLNTSKNKVLKLSYEYLKA